MPNVVKWDSIEWHGQMWGFKEGYRVKKSSIKSCTGWGLKSDIHEKHKAFLQQLQRPSVNQILYIMLASGHPSAWKRSTFWGGKGNKKQFQIFPFVTLGIVFVDFYILSPKVGLNKGYKVRYGTCGLLFAFGHNFPKDG